MPKKGQGAKARQRKSKSRPEKKSEKGPDKVPEDNSSRAMLIVNPSAGTGSALKIWGELEETLRDLGLDFDYQFTEYPEHAIAISTSAAEKGYGIVLVVGGDGTIYEVSNGIMAVDRDKRPALGVIPCGRGSDFCRTLEIPQDWKTAASLAVSGRRRTIDMGWMEYNTPEGLRTGYFANIAGLGFDGEVTERANSMPAGLERVIGGTASYFLSLVVTYAKYREKDVELHVDDSVFRVLATTVVIANCQYFGGKMRIAPDAVPDDGVFDIIVMGAGFGPPIIELPSDQPPPEHSRLSRGFAKARVATNIPRVYRGTHLKDQSVMVRRGSKVEVISDDRMVLQADGEVIGVGPLIAEVVPKAIDIIA